MNKCLMAYQYIVPHGYLLNQFYFPLTNKHTNIYSCKTIENRIKLNLEGIQGEITQAIGSEIEQPKASLLHRC